MMEIIKSNIRLTMNDGIFTNIHATMSTLNMNRLYHFISWGFEEKFFNHPLTNFDINMVKLPRNLSPLFTPMPNIDEVDMMNKRIKQIYENSKNNLRPNMKKEIERAIMKIDKIVAVQKKKFGNRILTFIPDPKQ
jgi:aminopeptidase-like protein